MSESQIIAIVTDVTGVQVEEMKQNPPIIALFAKYVSVVMLHEEGYTHVDIALAIGCHRTSVYPALKTINSLLETNKIFKNMYLACIAKLSEMEDAA